MTSQVSSGSENAVAPRDHPPVPTGYPQYSTAPDYHVPAQPVPTYPAVTYPQDGAAVRPAPVPYPQPGAQPSPAVYPTAPPWAPQAPGGPSTAPEEPLSQHGGLLVPFPEEMQHASRSQAPAVWPVAVFTLLFGLFGLISAVRRAGHARRTRNSTAPYWITFLIAAVAGYVVWFVVAAVVIQPMITEFQEGRRLEAVQRNVLGDGQLKEARIAVTAAQCRPVTDRSVDGTRDYLCQLTLEGGRTASLALTADESGQWQSERKR